MRKAYNSWLIIGKPELERVFFEHLVTLSGFNKTQIANFLHIKLSSLSNVFGRKRNSPIVLQYLERLSIAAGYDRSNYNKWVLEFAQGKKKIFSNKKD